MFNRGILYATDITNVHLRSISYRTSRDAAATGESVDCPARNASSTEAEVSLKAKTMQINIK